MMVGSERRRRVVLGVASLAVVALVLLVANVALMLTSDAMRTTLVVWTIGPAATVVLLAVVGLWVRRDRDRALYLGRVAAWALLGAVALGTGGAVNGYLNAVEGVAPRMTVEVFVGWAAGGLLDGGLIGIYDAERRLERERTEQARQEAEQLAAGLSVVNRVLRHDLRNHATVLEGQIDALDADAGRTETIRRHVERIVELADQGRQMESVLRADDRIVADASDVVERVSEKFRTTRDDVSITVEAPESAAVSVGSMFEVAVENLVENAIVHHDGDPTVEVAVRAVDGETVELRVADDGPGIPTFERELVAGEREVSQLEHGSGLGLWIARWTAESLGGSLALLDREPRGTVARLRLRAARPHGGVRQS